MWEFRAVDATFKGVDIDLSYTPIKGILLKNNTSWIEAKEATSRDPILINIPPIATTLILLFRQVVGSHFSFEFNAKNVFRQNQYSNHNFELDIVEDGQYIDQNN